MCEAKRYKKIPNTRIDKCMLKEVARIQRRLDTKICPATLNLRTIASCCGHEKYPRTVVIRNESNIGNVHYEYYTNKLIPRKRNFYKRDEEGIYYIKEVSKKS